MILYSNVSEAFSASIISESFPPWLWRQRRHLKRGNIVQFWRGWLPGKNLLQKKNNENKNEVNSSQRVGDGKQSQISVLWAGIWTVTLKVVCSYRALQFVAQTNVGLLFQWPSDHPDINILQTGRGSRWGGGGGPSRAVMVIEQLSIFTRTAKMRRYVCLNNLGAANANWRHKRTDRPVGPSCTTKTTFLLFTFKQMDKMSEGIVSTINDYHTVKIFDNIEHSFCWKLIQQCWATCLARQPI
jgi:hypothetical protein